MVWPNFAAGKAGQFSEPPVKAGRAPSQRTKVQVFHCYMTACFWAFFFLTKKSEQKILDIIRKKSQLPFFSLISQHVNELVGGKIDFFPSAKSSNWTKMVGCSTLVASSQMEEDFLLDNRRVDLNSCYFLPDKSNGI